MFATEGIDHVALTVRDVGRSVAWYREVLGLERLYEEAWGDYPAVVGAGTTCLALFPCPVDESGLPPDNATIAMRHVAFRVDRHNFEAAQAELRRRGSAFDFQDHTIAHSIYFPNLDGHRLEITTYDLPDR